MEQRRDIAFATAEGAPLLGDLYLPAGPGPHPVLVAVHGGGWQMGDRGFYQHLGPVLAADGVGVFSIDYRLAAPGRPTYPGAVADVRAALRFLAGNAAEYRIDPARMGLIGDSAGGHLAALTALAGNEPPFAEEAPVAVKAVIAFYGVYDLVAQWHHDTLARPTDRITEKFLGAAPVENRRVYFEASPISHAIRAHNGIAFLLAQGTEDDVVERGQADAFLLALKQAQYFARLIILQGAGHFWATFPVEEPGGALAQFLPHLRRFLQERL
jgi:acetyl esterase/lipase